MLAKFQEDDNVFDVSESIQGTVRFGASGLLQTLQGTEKFPRRLSLIVT